jgi:hypothetical protein
MIPAQGDDLAAALKVETECEHGAADFILLLQQAPCNKWITSYLITASGAFSRKHLTTVGMQRLQLKKQLQLCMVGSSVPCHALYTFWLVRSHIPLNFYYQVLLLHSHRHGQSSGNTDMNTYASIPDPDLPLVSIAAKEPWRSAVIRLSQ